MRSIVIVVADGLVFSVVITHGVVKWPLLGGSTRSSSACVCGGIPATQVSRHLPGRGGRRRDGTRPTSSLEKLKRTPGSPTDPHPRAATHGG